MTLFDNVSPTCLTASLAFILGWFGRKIARYARLETIRVLCFIGELSWARLHLPAAADVRDFTPSKLPYMRTTLSLPNGDSSEPLLAPTADRLIIFPLKDSEIWDFYKLHEASFWTAEEIDFATDVTDWTTKLSLSERALFSMILAFFASADSIVNENLLQHFSSEVQLPEARYFYTFQAAMENIHSEVYSATIQTVIRDEAERLRLFNGISEYPCVAAKASWALHWAQSTASFPQRLVAFAAVEGIFFSGSFAAIYWLKRRGVMPGLCFSNELICRDEGLHTDFACFLYTRLRSKLLTDDIARILTEACSIEKAFWTDIMPSDLLGMNAVLMHQYIEFVTDRLLVALGCAKLYCVGNPFPFMDMISLRGKTNFFERRNAEYALANVGQKDENFRKLVFDADF
ncbi:ribonucleoside-diphosphate reductase [Armillaria solidipes]|uniref:Ribonucleoside-diphosphate reductase n=1 Tax=Armillaria solidipes TaxID=1076256 RepID=A0A2H3B8J8_9AGAR|nr:ribonucleoside-diphosphate reductase [Armillaria solidipes]